MTRKASGVRARFERYFRNQHPQDFIRPKCDWFERSDIWGAPGYAQPCVHFEWLAYHAGYKAGRK